MVVVLQGTTSERETPDAMKVQQPTGAARPLPPDRRTGKGFFGRTVGAFIPKVVAPAFEKFGFHTAEIMTSWETIAGVDLARMTRPEAIKWPRGTKARSAVDDDGARAAGATLVIACDPAFALEVSYRTQDIIDRINRYFGYRAIAQIRVVQTPQKADVSIARQPERPLSVRSAPRPAGGDDADGLSAALAALRDSVFAVRQAR
jgi:hypothetical protein